MRTPRSALFFFLLLGFSVYLAVPVENLRETAYDESEALPYEETPLFSIVVPLMAVQRTLVAARFADRNPRALFRLPSTGVRYTDAHRVADVRITLALMSALLC